MDAISRCVQISGACGAPLLAQAVTMLGAVVYTVRKLGPMIRRNP